MDRENVPYADWLKYIRTAVDKGRNCEEFVLLQRSTPVLPGTGYEAYLADEIGKLEERLIRDAVDAFQKSLNKSFEEADIYLFEKGIRAFKKCIAESVFFVGMDGISATVKESMLKSINTNYLRFVEEIGKYIKKITYYQSHAFLNELEYLFKKAGLKKYIQELTVYE